MVNSGATFVCDHDKIKITIEDEEIELSVNDCIKVKEHYGGEEEKEIVGKISHFGFSGAQGVPNRIFIRKLRGNRWSNTGTVTAVGLHGSYALKNGIHWNTIVKVPCPVAINLDGGKRKKRSVKKTSRRRYRKHTKKH